MERLLTSQEAAKHLGYSEYTLRRSRSCGQLSGSKAPKYIKLGRAIRYRLSDLQAWVEEVSCGHGQGD